MSTDDPDGKDSADEPRAKDLLTRPREELERVMDPATLAQLASWFDMPNLAVVEDASELDEDQSAEERVLEELRKRKEAACAAADPAFVKHIERHERVNINVMPDFQLAPIVDETIVNRAVRAQLERQSATEDSIADASEYQQPGDVYEILIKHNAPQAILRDLYRPVREYEARLESPFTEEELPNLDPAREVREMLCARYQPEWLPPTFQLGAEARAAGKARLREPWAAYMDILNEQKARGER